MFRVSGPEDSRVPGVTAAIVRRIELVEPDHTHTAPCELEAN